ncbi:unnamed protein product [Arctogadus glacialis]
MHLLPNEPGFCPAIRLPQFKFVRIFRIAGGLLKPPLGSRSVLTGTALVLLSLSHGGVAPPPPIWLIFPFLLRNTLTEKQPKAMLPVNDRRISE